MDVLKLIEELKVIPLATLTSEEEVLEICNCLSLASITVIEVTLRDERVKNILKYFKNYSNIALGVGTVRTVNDIDLALESGASFIITPGFSSSLSSYAKNKGILLIPGIQTPSEVIQASEAGHKILKFFPAELSGGVERLNAYKSVFPDIAFIPTGGINEDNINRYLNLKNVIASGASAMIPENLVCNKSWDEITSKLINIRKVVNKV